MAVLPLSHALSEEKTDPLPERKLAYGHRSIQ